MMQILKKLSFLAALVAISATALPNLAHAATLSAVRVTTTGNGSLTMAPGEFKDITVTFQNTGTTAWKNDGPGYVSIYTYGPKYRRSVFDPGTWLAPEQVKRIIESNVAPQGTATVKFALHAPTTPGSYSETFNLASEDTAWIPGGEFTLSINVVAGAPPSSDDQAGMVSTEGYNAQLVTQTAKSVSVKAGKTVVFTALFKNTGSQVWTNYGLKTPDLALASASRVSFDHSSWEGSQVALVTDHQIKPGESAMVDFVFTAPTTNGTHMAKFQLTANGVPVPAAFIELPVTVTGGAQSIIAEPITEDTGHYIDEPLIRVGVLIIDEETNDEVVITSHESDFKLVDESGDQLGAYKAGDEVRVAFLNGKYYYIDNEHSERSTTKPVRFVPNKDHAVMTITNFDRRVTRGSARANNTFRNVLEIRYNDTYERTWVINELKMEYYLRGLGETSNISHLEFQKALLTAARTYAMYHWERGTKHRAEKYHVDAYSDQVYFGYGQEEVTPRITEAVEATRGNIVTYDNATAITAYFSRSDGRTRDWSDVWGGDVPWSKGVSVPCDVGRTLWGHGVGMSASGALCMANDGQTWEEILHYFYTGIDIQKRWN
jgi:uncharacterized cupredoxin-like copper-binding protein